MDAATYTLDRLQGLEQLYRHGFHSVVIDQTINKLLAAEIQQTQAEQRDLQIRLSAYEEQYDMLSEEFYRRFRSGELGDGIDFVEWSVFYEMYQALLERLRLLGTAV